MMGTLPAVPLAVGEQNGMKFATAVGKDSLAALRAIPANELLEMTVKPGGRFSPTVDGYFLPKPPLEIFAAGEQAHGDPGAGGGVGLTPADRIEDRFPGRSYPFSIRGPSCPLEAIPDIPESAIRHIDNFQRPFMYGDRVL